MTSMIVRLAFNVLNSSLNYNVIVHFEHSTKNTCLNDTARISTKHLNFIKR